MYSSVISAAVSGLEACLVHVETDVGPGLPYFEMSGFLGVEVREAKERVRVAIKNTGIDIKPQRIIVNISPANIRKEGTAFDLPIAVGVLLSNGYEYPKDLDSMMFLGELSLDGSVNPVNGVLPCVIAAGNNGIRKCFVPVDNAMEGAIAKNVEVYGIHNLNDIIGYFNGTIELEPIKEKLSRKLNIDLDESEDDNNFRNSDVDDEKLDFADIRGQNVAKRATVIAVAGMHNIMFMGTPGSGKTMMAKRIPSIMPELAYDESIELTKIYSVAGLLGNNAALIRKRPFRSPHHHVTETAMLGGGRIPHPGEVTLSGKGVLFLDEVTMYKTEVLEALRQPLEDKKITIVRLNAAYTYPADFMMVAAMNPCKCGYYPDRNRCGCSEQDIRRYMGKISTPVWDRFDICIHTDEVKYDDIKDTDIVDNDFYNSQHMMELVKRARAVQEKRFNRTKIHFNSEMSTRDIQRYCSLDVAEQDLMGKIYEKLKLTARGYHRVLKVARTIADVEGSENITTVHLSEAVTYRNLNKR